MATEVTDVWFRSHLPLAEIAQQLGLRDVTDDAEDYWAWVIGTLSDTRLDITRTHTRPANSVDTRIFVLGGAFTEPLLDELVGRLRSFVPGPIRCGRWEYHCGHEFDLTVVQAFESANAPPLDRLPEGWFVSDPDIAASMEQELARELTRGHMLDGKPVRVIAHREGTDDILCQHLADPIRFTVIHLTRIGRTEIDHKHPCVEADGSFEDFLAYERRWLGR
jgi:hypothetical protein